MKSFTFCVLTYNHENYILDTLESIKYQVKNYALNKIKVDLIIGEDNSTDNTKKIVDFWLNLNFDLFNRVVFLSNDKNIGACKTIVNMFSEIKTDDFKLIEGDDLFSSLNIFDLFEKNKTSNVVSATSFRFYNYKILDDRNKYVSTLSKSLLSKRLIKVLTTISVPFNGSSMWYKKSLITEKMINRLSNYFVIGDRNIWFSLFHDWSLKDISYSFEMNPIILYRINEYSITSETSPAKDKYNLDYNDYIESLKSEKLNFMERILYNNFVYAKKNNRKYFNLLSYINKFLDKYSFIFTNSKLNHFLEMLEVQQEYLEEIKNKTRLLLGEFYEKS